MSHAGAALKRVRTGDVANPRRRRLVAATLAGGALSTFGASAVAQSLQAGAGVSAAVPLSGPASGPASVPTPAQWAALTQAARKEGELTVYTAAFGQGQHVTIGKAFEKMYGIRVQFLAARASEIRERVRSEQASGRFIADVSHDGSTTSSLQVRDGVFQPYGGLPNLSLLRAPFVANDYLVPAFALPYSILVNTRLVPEAVAPKSWADLTDARWHGKILSDDMRALGGGGVMFSVLYDKLGVDFHKHLAMNQPSFSRDVRASEQRVARGEYAIWIPFTANDIFALTGLPVRNVIPSEGVPYIEYDLALLKNAPHPNAARLFMNFFLADAAQAVYAQDGLTPVTGFDLHDPDPDKRALREAKLLGTTDPERMSEMLALAGRIYS